MVNCMSTTCKIEAIGVRFCKTVTIILKSTVCQPIINSVDADQASELPSASSKGAVGENLGVKISRDNLIPDQLFRVKEVPGNWKPNFQWVYRYWVCKGFNNSFPIVLGKITLKILHNII